jgi:site-specific recombinase XerD
MAQNNDIYPNSYNYYEREKERLLKANISQSNKKVIITWQQFLQASGASYQRIAKLTLQMRCLCIKLKANLINATKNDIESIIAYYNTLSTLSEATKADYRRLIKQFYKWYKEEDPRLQRQPTFDSITLVKISRGDLKPEELNKIIMAQQEAEKEYYDCIKFYKYIESIKREYRLNQIDPTLIISDDDCLNIINDGCQNTKERAFIACLHETGARIGEFLGIRIKDCQLKENHAEIEVTGKTGRRTLFCYNSFPYLIRYLEMHPFKKHRDELLWRCDNSRYMKKPLRYIGASDLVKRVMKRANFDKHKKTNLHWFRHSRATIWAPQMTEPLLRKAMGWSKSSTMIKNYGHLCKKDLHDVVKSINGVSTIEEKANKPIICTCGAVNPHNERYCHRCSRALKVEYLMQDQELLNTETGSTIKLMLEVLKDPEAMKSFENYKKKRGEKNVQT